MATTIKSMVRIKVRVMIEEGTTGGTTTDETTMAGEERFEAITTGEEKTVEEMTTEITTGEKTVEEKIAEETTAEITTEEKTAEEKTVEETTIEITTGEKTAGEGGRLDGETTEIMTEESHRMTGRQRKSLQAKELQMSYWSGAKKCVEKVLGEAEE